MGFVIWFQLQVTGTDGIPPLRVSNDVFSGDYILDADIRVDLVPGAATSTFCAVLVNLPADVADSLTSRHRAALAHGTPLEATVGLGYFDDPQSRLAPVLRATVTGVRTSVTADGDLATEIRGCESAGYRLRKATIPAARSGARSLDEFVAAIADAAGVRVESAPGLGQVSDFTVRAGSGLDALRTVADTARAPLVVRDGAVFIGQAVGAEQAVAFSTADNIVRLDRRQDEAEETEAAAEARTSLELVTLGDPTVRVGRPATLTTDDPADALPGPLRVEHARHLFTTRAGYTCEVLVVSARPGERARRPTGVSGVVDRLRDLAGTVHDERPAWDMGEIQAYETGGDGKHLASLRYGQSPPADAVAPSVEVPVDQEPLLHAKPLVSPFAFHKCGLVVPVLPGMRAVLGHNRGLVNDAVVAGYVWAEQPRLQPPKNAAGDWWLCLPTGLDDAGLPTGKGVNDLTDATGRRVVQAQGLRITVGAGTLPDVGERPDVPDDLAGRLVIEHESGATVAIGPDGAVTVDTGGKDITLTSGDASITLSGGTITLHGSSVEVS